MCGEVYNEVSRGASVNWSRVVVVVLLVLLEEQMLDFQALVGHPQ